MCKELDEELERGKQAELALIKHLENMGADRLDSPVTTDNGCYQIKVIKTF